MPKEYPRANRVAARIREDLGEIITAEVKDPRIGLVSVTDVDVSPDLSHARVYVSALGDATKADEAAALLNKAAPFLRTRLAKKLDMRYTPGIRFVGDHSMAQGDRIAELLRQADAKRHGNEA